MSDIFSKILLTLGAIGVCCCLIGFIGYGRYPMWTQVGAFWVCAGQGMFILVAFLCIAYKIISKDVQP